MSETLFSDPASFVRAPRLSGLSASRDGRVIVTRRTISEEQNAFLDQLFEVTEDSARQLTFGTKSAALLAIGKRGEIYFSRNDPGAESKGDAIWMLPPSGEAREIFRYRGGIESVSATESNLLVTLSVLPSAWSDGASVEQALARSAELNKKREDAKVSGVLYARYPTRSWDHDEAAGECHLFISPLPELSAPTGIDPPKKADTDKKNEDHAAKLPASELKLTEVALPPRPDGVSDWDLDQVLASDDGSIAMITMRRRTEIDPVTEVYLLDLLSDDEPKLLFGAPDADISGELIYPDANAGILGHYLPPLPGQTVDIELQKIDFKSGEIVLLARSECNSMAVGAGNVLYLANDRGGRGGVFSVSSPEELRLVTPDDEYSYSSIAWAKDKLVALRSSIAEPATVVFIDPASGTVTEGPQLTPELELPGELTEVEAVATDGTPLRAWLAVPDGEGPHPLVVFAHGGPWGSWNDWTWRWNPWVFVARGYAVLLPDPGISTGYGQEMTSRGHDSIGDEPFTDIMALTDATIDRDDIDESRQLFAGGSYGGYMANWVAGHTGSRFKGIVTHASLWNIESMARTTDNGSWYRWMMAPIPAGPRQGPAQAELWSPHRFAQDIKVPMLVIHGDQDYRVPIGQGLELWMDLQRTSPELAHQFLYFPDEGHWILKPGNAQVWYETFLAFLDQHSEDRDFVRPELLG
ncbi:prolyl oligopeptidase family serine peptidase [Actinomycetaceae bacterium MB13-C1-2]|nr:prolyl oligopeptidase family serine peptidase [Actinomycetaceae bacterium MB13-C1-2]